jgi:phospholipid/cholesterol/gamma-HCH transport system substrate-binding protein
MKKISNELKVGLIVLITLGLIVFGYNFLKGSKVFDDTKYYYAVFNEVGELTVSSPVKIKGLEVGNVAYIKALDKELSRIVVAIKMKGDYKITNNSEAFINTSILGTSNLEIKRGSNTQYYSLGDTIKTNSNPKFLDEVQDKINPVLGKVNKSLGSLDTLLSNAGNLLDKDLKTNVDASLYNVRKLTADLLASSASLQVMLNSQSGALAGSLNNVERFTKNLNSNNEKINGTIGNLNTTTDKFAQLDLDGTLKKLNSSIDGLNTLLQGVNNPNGTLGKVLNDRLLYDRLNNTVKSMNILLDDLKTNPKRYVNISVFGKKNKKSALDNTLINADSSLLK